MRAHASACPIDLRSYDYVLVAFSGGKDSLACLLALIEQGVDPRRIELHHHDVDGGGPLFMDWPCTASYCQAVADALGIRLFTSYREGGFWREMHRENAPTAPVIFETPDGSIGRAGGASSSLGTRLKFPQVSASLAVRWCSAALKVGVMDALIANQDRFFGAKTLVVTGERAEESANRAHYATFEPHRVDLRQSKRRARHVDHFRPVHAWTAAEVWEIIERHGISPHVAYQLGFGRLSCAACIFGNADHFATYRHLFPSLFRLLVEREQAFGVTIKRATSLSDLADRGAIYPTALGRPDLVAQARDAVWRLPTITRRRDWLLPAGAYGDASGPS